MRGAKPTGVWTVSLEVVCSVESCPAADASTARATSCAEARHEAMKEMRNKGWQVGNYKPVLCPEHIPSVEEGNGQ